MSNLRTVEDIKIPYPVEGIVRTAQLDDTVAPEDSVQLAVNMNFDRIGAIQTRKGITQFADQLGGEISNFGSLKNAFNGPGYEEFVVVGEKSVFNAAETDDVTTARVDDDHVIVFWKDDDTGDGFVQVMETDISTGGLIPIGTPFEFDSSTASQNQCVRVDGNHFLNVWQGVAADAFAQVFEVNPITFAVTSKGTAFEFDTSDGNDFTMTAVDSSHFIVFYGNDVAVEGKATILEVNLSTFAVTEPGSKFTFFAGDVLFNSCAPIGDGTHFINFWHDLSGVEGLAQVFLVDTGTWTISAVGSPLTFDSDGVARNSVNSLEDGEHFINFWSSFPGDGFAQVFNVDPSTYAVTAVGTSLEFQSGAPVDTASIGFGDGNNFFTIWVRLGVTYAQIFNADPATFAVTGVQSPLVLGGESGQGSNSLVRMTDYKVIGFWGNEDDEAVGALFRAQNNLEFGKFLFAGVGDEVSNWEGTAWTVRRSGLATVSKPRFSQFLNYLWMVNGNQTLGGDPVATSNGGDFAQDLVPSGFPKGDFIHGGFEGRVWVADKTAGIIYYTDIVQFAPPNVYTLTFNPDVNFITNLSPQTGQSFTALFRVPRALLVFTEDSIFRIYGATSIDAYPAYNVGTFSQESIIETKTGIFFHHSSGFYEFNYGSQPVEISRKIIDFVKAIPRSYYENVKGVYDGVDTVQWYVGQVTVEGVVFSNCVLRYTISSQVWTIYDYKNNNITAEILYDNGTVRTHLAGTEEGKVGSLDTGNTDFGQGFYYEYIDRWRAFTEMYYVTKALNGVNIYSENAAGTNVYYQVKKSGPNAWKHLATVDERSNALFPTEGTEDFEVLRLRMAGNTKGEQVVIHGIEVASLTIKGQDTN